MRFLTRLTVMLSCCNDDDDDDELLREMRGVEIMLPMAPVSTTNGRNGDFISCLSIACPSVQKHRKANSDVIGKGEGKGFFLEGRRSAKP